MRTTLALAATFALLPLTAHAEPATLAVQGRLAALGGGPVADGTYPVKIALYASKAAAKSVYSEAFLAVGVSGGVFALVLGEGENPLDGVVLGGADKPVWIGVTVAAEPELERAVLRPVPYAVHAGLAKAAAGLACSGCVGAGELGDGAVVAAKIAKGAVTGDAIQPGAVTAQHVAFSYAGSDSKGGPATLALAANTAKTAESAAAADEAKSAQVAAKIQCTGCVAFAHLAENVVADLVTAKKLAKVAVTGAYENLTGGPDLSPYAKLDGANSWKQLQGFQAAVNLSAGKDPTCDDKSEGMLWFSTAQKKLLLCLGGKAVPVALQQALGTQESPALSCKQVQETNQVTKTGLYWLDVDGTGPLAPVQAHCDMDTDGGGWTRVFGIDLPNGGAKSPNPVNAIVAGLKAAAEGNGYVDTVRMGDLRALYAWKELRFWCKKPSVGRTIHIKTSDANVIAYFTAKTDVFPKAPGSFTAYADDTSILAKQPDQWGYVAPNFNTGTWGHGNLVSATDRLSDHAFFVGGKYHWYLDGNTRQECDDMSSNAAGNWYVWVR